MIDIFGLENTPNFLTDLIQNLTDNRVLTDIMLNKKGCPFVRTENYKIIDKPSKFHNVCADSFEAMIGAMFYHVQQLNLDTVKIIKMWLLQNTDIVFYITAYLKEEGMDSSRVYTLLDKQKLVEKANSKMRNLLHDLEELKQDLNPELYESLRATIHDNFVSTIDEFASRAILIDTEDSLQEIYRKLGWVYQEPQFDTDIEGYTVEGYPNSYRKRIGYGDTPQEAILDARQYLVDMGYIVPTITIQRYYT